MREIAKKLKISYKVVSTFTEQPNLALTRIERVGGPDVQLSESTSTLVSSLRNRRLTSPQLAASLNRTCKKHQSQRQQ